MSLVPSVSRLGRGRHRESLTAWRSRALTRHEPRRCLALATRPLTMVTPSGRLRKSSWHGKHHARLQPADLFRREAETQNIGVGVEIAATKTTFTKKGPSKTVEDSGLAWTHNCHGVSLHQVKDQCAKRSTGTVLFQSL